MSIEWPEQRTNARELKRHLLAACERWGVPVKFVARVEDSDELAGAAYRDRIEVVDSLETVEAAGTLIHELAHECLHYDINGDCGFSREFEEMEARDVEQRVLAHFGVKPLIKKLAKGSPRVRAAVDRIVSEVEQEQAAEVVTALEKFNHAVGGLL